MRQTSIQDADAIRKGSVRVLVGEDFDTLVDIGALRTPAVSLLAEAQRVEFENANGLDYYVKGDRIQVTFDLAEINFDTIAVLDAGMVSVTTVAGVLVEGAIQLVVAGNWLFNKFIKITNQNGDASAITVNSVTGGTDGLLTNEDDYYVGQNENGEYGIFIKDTVDVTTENQNLTIDYDYTPNASKKITTSNSGKKTLKVMRIINENNDGKLFKIDIEDGTNFAPISVDFAGDEEDDVAIQPVDFRGTLVEWVDEQNVA